jgi:hypothetical protein
MKDTHIKQVFNKFGTDDTQNIFTPPSLCREMLSHIEFKGDEKVLVLYNLEFALILNQEFGLPTSSIYIYTNSKTKQAFSKYGFNILYFEDALGLNKVDMKFDITIMNPPYDGKSELHLQFLNYAVNNTLHYVSCIHPSAWMLTKTHNKQMKKQEILAVQNIHKYHTEFKFVNGNEIFPNANFFYPLIITNIDKTQLHPECFLIEDKINNRTLKFTNFNDINFHSDSDEYISLRKRLLSYIMSNDTLYSVGNIKKKYNVPLSKIRGSQCDINFFKDDFYTLIPRDCSPLMETNLDFIYGFDSLEEANNFINYLKTNFVRFCLSLYKITGNIKSGNIHKSIPYLDFKEKWDDEKLFKFFNITEQEQQIINKIIPPFYSNETSPK